MADEIRVRPGSLRKAGSDLHRAAEELDTEWRSFQTEARSLSYGSTDLVGSLIGETYTAVLEWAHISYSTAAKAFGSFGTALHSMADLYDTAETTTRQAADGAGKML